MTSLGGVVSGAYERVWLGRGVAMRSTRMVLVAGCITVLGVLVFGAGLAQAHLGHIKVAEFSSKGEVATGIAINQANEDIYVANVEPGNVKVFNAAHTEVLNTITGAETHAGSFGGHMNIAIDNASDVESKGDLYVPDEINGVVDKFGSDGHFICELNVTEGTPCSATVTSAFSGPEAVAVDPSSGYVYVSDRGNNRVAVFSPAGVFIASFAGEGELALSAPRDIKVDSLGNVYVATQAIPFAFFGVVKFTPSSLPVTSGTTWTESVLSSLGNASAIATTSANNVYVVAPLEGSEPATEYDPAGEVLTHFGGELPTGFGIAVNDTSNDIYYANTFGNSVFVFNSVLIPTVLTGGPASEVDHTSAKVEGTVNPEGLTVTGCFFEYGAGLQTPCDLSGAEIGTGSAPVTVTAKLEGLEPGQTYHYRLVAESGGNKSEGSSETFATPPLATVVTEAPTTVKPESATLNGTVTLLVPSGGEYYFEYGKEVTENKTTATVVTGEEPVQVQVPVGALEPSALYHARLVVEVEGHVVTAPGPEVEFLTPPLATAETNTATGIQTESATLNGTLVLNTTGATNYHFVYKKIENEEVISETSTTPVAISGEGSHAVNTNVTGLTPAATYRFHVVAEVVGHPPLVEGGEVAFTSRPLAPVVTIEPAASITRTTTLLSGTINPNNSGTTYHFEYENINNGLVYVTPPRTVPRGTVTVPVGPEAISGLLAGTTYHYRLVADNPGGTGTTTNREFTTAPPKPPIIGPETASNISQTTVTLTGTVNPNGLQTHYALELGIDTSYGTPIFGEAGNGTEAQQLTFTLTSLLPGTTYHYRITATNEDGTVNGTDQTFTTPGFPPIILTPPPVQIIPFTPPPTETKHTTTLRKTQTKAQKLAKALKACKRKPKNQRAKCMKQAHKKYSSNKKKNK